MMTKREAMIRIINQMNLIKDDRQRFVIFVPHWHDIPDRSMEFKSLWNQGPYQLRPQVYTQSNTETGKIMTSSGVVTIREISSIQWLRGEHLTGVYCSDRISRDGKERAMTLHPYRYFEFEDR